MIPSNRVDLYLLISSLIIQHVVNSLHYVEGGRESDSVTPHFIFGAVGMELVIPFQYLLLCILLGGYAVYDFVCVFNLKPEIIFLICKACLIIRHTPIISKALQSSTFNGRKTADYVAIAIINHGFGQCNVEDWTDIVAISAGSDHTVGLKSDGTVVAVGLNNDGQCLVGA